MLSDSSISWKAYLPCLRTRDKLEGLDSSQQRYKVVSSYSLSIVPLLQPVVAATASKAAHTKTTFFIVLMCLLFNFGLLFHLCSFTAHRCGVALQGCKTPFQFRNTLLRPCKTPFQFRNTLLHPCKTLFQIRNTLSHPATPCFISETYLCIPATPCFNFKTHFCNPAMTVFKTVSPFRAPRQAVSKPIGTGAGTRCFIDFPFPFLR